MDISENAWLGQNRSGPTQEFPSYPACRTILHARGKRDEKKIQGEDFTWRGGSSCWWCCGGGVVAHGRQLQAAVLLFQTAEGEVTALPFLLRMASSVFRWFPPSQYRFASIFFVCSVLSLLFLSLVRSLSSLQSFLPFFFFFDPLRLRFFSLFIGEKG